MKKISCCCCVVIIEEEEEEEEERKKKIIKRSPSEFATTRHATTHGQINPLPA